MDWFWHVLVDLETQHADGVLTDVEYREQRARADLYTTGQ